MGDSYLAGPLWAAALRSSAMVRIYQGTGPTDAWLVRDWLVRNAIDAWMRGEHLIGLQGQVPITWPSVWVRECDRDAAEAAMRAFEGPVLVHPDWVCLGCGEVNGASFGSCWSCQVDAPGNDFAP